ncbi:Scr1 family TA system antitoxin-like transcriptional regulator [Streptomyces sp. L7]
MQTAACTPRPSSGSAAPWTPRTRSSAASKLRMTRQELLRPAPEAPKAVRSLVDEAALRRPLGGAEGMRDQLRHLVETAALPNVTLQVLPFEVGAAMRRPAVRSPCCASRSTDLPDIVYLGNSSPAPCTWTRRRRSTAISRSWTG